MYTFTTPAGQITVDHTYTIGRLIALGAKPVNFAFLRSTPNSVYSLSANGAIANPR